MMMVHCSLLLLLLFCVATTRAFVAPSVRRRHSTSLSMKRPALGQIATGLLKLESTQVDASSVEGNQGRVAWQANGAEREGRQLPTSSLKQLPRALSAAGSSNSSQTLLPESATNKLWKRQQILLLTATKWPRFPLQRARFVDAQRAPLTSRGLPTSCLSWMSWRVKGMKHELACSLVGWPRQRRLGSLLGWRQRRARAHRLPALRARPALAHRACPSSP